MIFLLLLAAQTTSISRSGIHVQVSAVPGPGICMSPFISNTSTDEFHPTFSTMISEHFFTCFLFLYSVVLPAQPRPSVRSEVMAAVNQDVDLTLVPGRTFIFLMQVLTHSYMIVPNCTYIYFHLWKKSLLNWTSHNSSKTTPELQPLQKKFTLLIKMFLFYSVSQSERIFGTDVGFKYTQKMVFTLVPGIILFTWIYNDQTP